MTDKHMPTDQLSGDLRIPLDEMLNRAPAEPTAERGQISPDVQQLLQMMDGGEKQGPVRNAFQSLADPTKSPAELAQAAQAAHLSRDELEEVLADMGHDPVKVQAVIGQLKPGKAQPVLSPEEDAAVDRKTLKEKLEAGRAELKPIEKDLKALVGQMKGKTPPSKEKVDESTSKAMKAIEKYLKNAPVGLLKFLLVYLPIAMIVTYIFILSKLPAKG